MSADAQLQFFIAALLSAVAFGCFALAAGLAGRARFAAALGAAAWLFGAIAVARNQVRVCWLGKLGLGQCAKGFAKNDISAAVLPDLSRWVTALVRAIAELTSH